MLHGVRYRGGNRSNTSQRQIRTVVLDSYRSLDYVIGRIYISQTRQCVYLAAEAKGLWEILN